MPTYEYVCTKCGHEMEAFQSMKDEPLKLCPSCKRRTLRRKVGSGAGLIFKGTGFYITDYKKKPDAKSGAGDGKPAPSETKAGSGDAKSTTKPAETKAPTPATK